TSAGSTYGESGGFVNQIDGLPTDPDFGTNGGYYWSYFHATVAADGTLAAWQYYTSSAADSRPQQGEAEGWLLTRSWEPTGPAVDRVFDAPAATSTATSTATATPTASETATATASASGSATATATSTATATATASGTPPTRSVSSAATKAATFITKHLPTADDGAGAEVAAVLGLATTQQCSYAPTIRSLVASLTGEAAAYIAGNPGRAANLAIMVSALGLDPTDFGGVDLIQAITSGTNPDGSVGSFPSAYTQALAVIALSRAGSSVPADLVTSLLSFQDSNGGFGYEWDGTFYTDPDSTALGIQALTAVGGHQAAVDQALAWAAANKNSDGYWTNYSPVDSTGLLGSAVQLAGGDADAALAWVQGQQLTGGGFPNELDGASADLLATSNALYLLTGTTMLDVRLGLAACPAGGSDPAATTQGAADNAELAATGSSPLLFPLGLAGIGLVALGGVLIISRRDWRRAQ
ncbi:MAG: hypothetical protein IT193_08910, partial [Propionibacteriaceae bacterium]|nr:hypothetical protein [Propionibacteriaceae bacterium]